MDCSIRIRYRRNQGERGACVPSVAYVPMPVTITSGNVYTLSATMFRGLSEDDTAIMIFGFFDASPSWNGSVSVDEGHAIAIAPRNNKPRFNPCSMVLSAPPTSLWWMAPTGSLMACTCRTAPNAWSAVAVELAPTNQVISFAPTPISLTNIFTIGMISGSTLPPYIDNLTLDVTPVTLGTPGDYNANGVVDAADYTVYRDHLVQSETLPNDSTPGSVTQADYDVWKSNFGNHPGSGSGATRGAQEPSIPSRHRRPGHTGTGHAAQEVFPSLTRRGQVTRKLCE